MIAEGERYVVRTVFNQSGYDLQPGWKFTVKRASGSQWSCEFDDKYLEYPFHDCCGDCNYGYGYYIFSHLIEEYCIRITEACAPDWQL